MLFWCDTCVNVVCSHCALINGEHYNHAIRPVAAQYAKLRSHAATLAPRIATLAQQLKDEIALTEALRTQTETKLATLLATTKQYPSQALAPVSALSKQLRRFLSQRTKQEQEVLTLTQNTLTSMSGATDAPSITRLSRLLASRPVWPFSGGVDLDDSGPKEQAIHNTLANTPWVAARAAFEAATTDATDGFVPCEVTCEADVPLADLLSASSGDGFVAEIGTVELCGVRFACSVRRGCGCGASPVLLSQQAQLQDSEDRAVTGAAIEGKPSNANANEGSSLTTSATPFPQCKCALVGEVTANILSASLATRYDACKARARAVTKLIESGDSDDVEDGIDNDNKANDTGKNISATSDLVDCGDAVSKNTCEFGTVRAIFTVLRNDDSKSSGGAQSDNDNTDSSGLVATMLLTDVNKRTAAVVFAQMADGQGVTTASIDAKWCVRVAVAFPDVFHEKRALHMLAEAVPVDWILRTESAAAVAFAEAEGAAKAAAEATAKVSVRTALEAVLEAPWKSVVLSDDWEAAFDSHMACSLEECGYPCRQAKEAVDGYTPSPAPARDYGFPSPAALMLLQTQARERILTYAMQKLKTNMTSDVVMRVKFRNASNTGHDQHHMVIRLDDKQFPHNAAHFRTAAQSYALGYQFHQCFVPSGQSPGTHLPFVTLHHYHSGPSCAKVPITLPKIDIVYGEYTAPAASENVTYPVGTVLMYPREVVPRKKTSGQGACDSPCFIVFKPCDATLLRGAVPVGLVMSYVRGETASTSDNSAHPFDENVLQCFETHAIPQPGQQCKSNSSYMCFDSFRRV